MRRAGFAAGVVAALVVFASPAWAAGGTIAMHKNPCGHDVKKGHVQAEWCTTTTTTTTTSPPPTTAAPTTTTSTTSTTAPPASVAPTTTSTTRVPVTAGTAPTTAAPAQQQVASAGANANNSGNTLPMTGSSSETTNWALVGLGALAFGGALLLATAKRPLLHRGKDA